jgi:hypothetical protein
MAPTYRPPALGHGNAQKLDSVAQVDGYEGWSSHRVADYFEDNGLGDYRELFIHHKITGKIAPLLTGQFSFKHFFNFNRVGLVLFRDFLTFLSQMLI